MDEAQWKRLRNSFPTEGIGGTTSSEIEHLKVRETFIKYKSNGRTYSRVYYLDQSEDAIYYQGSKHKCERIACRINDITDIRPGFTTAVWKKNVKQRRIPSDKEHLAFSIFFDNNRRSIDLLASSEEICSRWSKGLDCLFRLYHFSRRNHYEIIKKKIRYLFKNADEDFSGQLNRQEVERLIFTLNIEIHPTDIDRYFNQANIRVASYEELTNLDWEELLTFYSYISHRSELPPIIHQYNGTKSNSSSSKTDDLKSFLSIEQLKNFLEKEQHMEAITKEDCAKLITRFEPSSEGQENKRMSVDGLRHLLLHDEFCIMNPDRRYRVYHDMTRPLKDYFIATSHNTYLENSQLYGQCTFETYIHAIRIGCRAVELDCYDGQNMEPIVYHVKGLTIAVAFREIITAIKSVAFTTSPYPLFLNLENHCSYEQQGVMARLLHETFQDDLVSKALVDHFETLPSPDQLKNRILIRSRRHFKEQTAVCHPDLANLIIYSEIVSFSDVDHPMKCSHSVSLKESKANDMLKQPHLMKLTNQRLVRVYPDAKRQDSSNIHPFDYWSHGIQMAALNYQSNDESMRLQQGFFSDNGGCGYLLKPSHLLSDNESSSVEEKLTKKIKYLQIEIISGQHLPKEGNCIEARDIVDPFVIVDIYEIGCKRKQFQTKSVPDNGLNPIWRHKIQAYISRPELCLIAFQVLEEDLCLPSVLLCQACLPFTALQRGYRHIKLCAPNGEHSYASLFVHIRITDA